MEVLKSLWGLIISLLVIFFFFYLIYSIIKWAIDNSETAKNIRDIKKILDEKFNINENRDNAGHDILTKTANECPGCHSKININDQFCSSCGLRIINDKEDKPYFEV